MFKSFCTIFYTIAVFGILISVNFQLGLTTLGISAFVWGLTTDHWKTSRG